MGGRNHDDTAAEPVRNWCHWFGAGAALVRNLWHSATNWCGTGSELVRNWCGTGAALVRHWCGTGADRVLNAGGTLAERRRGVLWLALCFIRHLFYGAFADPHTACYTPAIERGADNIVTKHICSRHGTGGVAMDHLHHPMTCHSRCSKSSARRGPRGGPRSTKTGGEERKGARWTGAVVRLTETHSHSSRSTRYSRSQHRPRQGAAAVARRRRSSSTARGSRRCLRRAGRSAGQAPWPSRRRAA